MHVNAGLLQIVNDMAYIFKTVDDAIIQLVIAVERFFDLCVCEHGMAYEAFGLFRLTLRRSSRGFGLAGTAKSSMAFWLTS